MKNELNGSLVLVHPELEEDPANRQGQIGAVKYARTDSEIYVGFLNGHEGIYSGEALLKLKDKGEIFNEVMNNSSAMDLDDFKAMYKIALLQDRGTPKAIFDALEIARDNPGIWDKTLDTAAQTNKQELVKTIGR